MSPSAYYYHEATLPPPSPQQLLNSIYPNPPSLPVTPDQLCNQKPSSYYSPLPFSRPTPPPPHHHHQQQPLPVSGKTQEYSWLMQQISTNKKTTKTISTTVMMRILILLSLMMFCLPKHSREMLMEIVDKHCIEENKKAMSNHHQDDILSEYDFLYLPIDFMNTRNLGYAFVNFTTCIAAMRFYKSFDNLSWMEKCSLTHLRSARLVPQEFRARMHM
ncbi:protein MEI2-like 4 [Papaver somniferum]|uniref:protein MEI2-like 4 n=1 Tax=Papaver somniferum TaxID=3469 RepID=UPI000E704273|nr:protein MEI2-like 4 [Papaver somniferum]